MSLNSYNAFYKNSTNPALPPIDSVRPLVTMDMIKNHFASIKQVQDDIKVIETGNQRGLVLPEERIRCNACGEWTAPTMKVAENIICELCNSYANGPSVVDITDKIPQLLRHDN